MDRGNAQQEQYCRVEAAHDVSVLATRRCRQGTLACRTHSEQHSWGANSPNVAGDHNQITINNGVPPDNRESRLVLQRRYEEAKADSITDTVIFTNNGNRATHLLDMRVLDADDNQVMSYKPPCDLVDPRLPANIEPGHAVTFKLKITAEQTQRARWFEWVREGQVNERRPWTNRDLYIYVSAAVASPGSS